MWIFTTEKENIQVALYMLNYAKPELLTAELRNFLTGWIQDCMDQIEADGGNFRTWVYANPVPRRMKMDLKTMECDICGEEKKCGHYVCFDNTNDTPKGLGNMILCNECKKIQEKVGLVQEDEW